MSDIEMPRCEVLVTVKDGPSGPQRIARTKRRGCTRKARHVAEHPDTGRRMYVCAPHRDMAVDGRIHPDGRAMTWNERNEWFAVERKHRARAARAFLRQVFGPPWLDGGLPSAAEVLMEGFEVAEDTPDRLLRQIVREVKSKRETKYSAPARRRAVVRAVAAWMDEHITWKGTGPVRPLLEAMDGPVLRWLLGSILVPFVERHADALDNLLASVGGEAEDTTAPEAEAAEAVEEAPEKPTKGKGRAPRKSS